MGLESIFGDVEAQGQAWDQADLDAEISERVRIGVATTTLVDRLCGHIGSSLRLWRCDGQQLAGVLESVGIDWLVLRTARTAILAPLSAVLAVEKLSGRSLPCRRERRKFGYILRVIAQNYTPCVLQVGCFEPGSLSWDGFIGHVGADYLEFKRTCHPEGHTRVTVAHRSIASIICPLEGLMGV